MQHTDYIQFLGTAGSRWVVSKQIRASGGIFLELLGKRILVDPGPGSLVRCSQTDPPVEPDSLDAIIVTHRHIDHCNDVTILADAMTGGGLTRRGVLFAPEDCLAPADSILFSYARPFLRDIVTLRPSTRYAIGPLAFTTSPPHDHGTQTYGLMFDVAGKILSFLVDTRLFDGLAEAYSGADTLVVNLTLSDPPGPRKIYHLGIDDVRRVLDIARPRRAVLTHFGLATLHAGPDSIAASLARDTGIEVIAAHDGMRLPV